MTFCYYNAHPKRLLVDDCTKRSIALTTGMSYCEVQRGLNRHKKVTGAKLFYNNPNPESYVVNVLGFAKRKPEGPAISVGEFAVRHPSGRYIISVSGHWTACIDGVVYDTWNCTNETVLSYYQITRYERTKIEKKYCFSVQKNNSDSVFVTVYDGNGTHIVKRLCEEEAETYAKKLYDRGFFCYEQVGEFI